MFFNGSRCSIVLNEFHQQISIDILWGKIEPGGPQKDLERLQHLFIGIHGHWRSTAVPPQVGLEGVDETRETLQAGCTN